MKAGRWLLLAIVASFAAMMMVSSAFGRGQSAVIFDYEVTNDGGILFADEYERLGGVDTLGYPASYRYMQGGFTYQVTQRALLQWRPEVGSAYLGNIFEMLEKAGHDQWLLQAKGIPLPIKDDGSGGDWNKAKATRLSWLTNEQIKAKYLANPNPSAISDWNEDRSIELYGLPMSMPEKHGPFISQRFQRVAFQLWVDEIPGSPAPGTVIGVLAGDLLKEAGLVPAEGLNVAERPTVVTAPQPAPAPAPAPSQSSPAPSQPAAPAVPEGSRLSALSLTGVTLSPAFSPTHTSYTGTAASGTATTDVTATKADDAADDPVIKLGGTVDDDGTGLALAANAVSVITIEVTGEDEKKVTYTVRVTRGQATTDASLSALSLNNNIALSPAFSWDRHSYTGVAASSVSSTTVAATATQSGATPAATVAYELNDSSHAAANMSLSPGSGNKIEVIVTASDGKTKQTYTITVTRLSSSGNTDASLASLTLSAGTLSPAFSSGHTSYTASVASSVENLTVTAPANATGATVDISPDSPVALGDAGTVTVITVEVTASDTTTTKTYLLRVTRGSVTPSTDATLSNLDLGDDVTVSPEFKRGTYAYTATVANSVTTVDVDADKNNNVSEVTLVYKINGATDTDGQGLAVSPGSNTVTVEVTAADGKTKRTYTITVTRLGTTGNTDATLSSLSLGGTESGDVALSPAFSPSHTTYTATVANSVASTDVTAVKNYTDATGPVITVTGAGSWSSPTATLGQGSNVITLVVTAQDTTITKTYTVTVTKLAAATNANLSSLTLSGFTLSPSFSSGTIDYTASGTAGAATLTVEKSDSNATVTSFTHNTTPVSDDDNDDSVSITTVSGSGTIVVLVTAEDGSTTKTYTVTYTAN